MLSTVNIACKIISLLLLSVLISFPYKSFAANSAIMELIEILNSKGSITNDEYLLLKNAAMADQEQAEAVETEIKQEVTNEIAVATKSMDAVSWASKVNLKGDVRLRYQGQKNDPGIGRNRGRLRYRLGVIAQPTSGWEVGAGLASGSSDLRSTNQSFDNTFSSKGINLDYAYAQYKFNDNIKVIGGKLKRAPYLYAASDLMWDGDINPEGFSANFTHNSEMGTTFANSGIWVLEEDSSSGNGPFMIYAQLGQNFGSENLFGTLAGTYYTFEDNIGLGNDSNPPAGTFLTDGSNSDFNFGGIIGLSGEIGFKDVFGNGIRTSIIADWVKNSDTTSNEDNGYLVGIKASKGPWSLGYSFVDLQQNAWPDILPDSDRFDGLTGIKGHEIAFSYRIMRNVAIDIDYYAVKSDVANEYQDLLQLDLNVRF